VVEEGSSVPKRKFGEEIFATGPPPKRGRADKVRELLRTIAFVRSNSIPTSFGPFGESGRCSFLGPFRWGSFFGRGSLGRLTRVRGEPNANGSGTENPPASRDEATQAPSRPVEQIPMYRGQPRRGHSRKSSPLIQSLGGGLDGNPLHTIT
jgi:hypothetical protein